MPKMSSPHFQVESWAICCWISFLINFGIVSICPIYQHLDKKIWFTIPFFYPKESCTYFVPIGVIKARITKYTPSILVKNCDHTICLVLSILFYQFYDPAYKTWLFEKMLFEPEASYSIKSICILVR